MQRPPRILSSIASLGLIVAASSIAHAQTADSTVPFNPRPAASIPNPYYIPPTRPAPVVRAAPAAYAQVVAAPVTPVVATHPAAAPVVAAHVITPVVPAPAAPSGAIDATKCLDLTGAQNTLKMQIVKAARDASSSGLKPALAYEGTKADPRFLTSRMDARAQAEADKLSKALFAAIADPTHAADVASRSMNGDTNRRASLEMYARCAGEDLSPREVVSNGRVDQHEAGLCAGGGAPVDMGLNISQVFQTSLSIDTVMVRFARSKFTSAGADQVSYCTPYNQDPSCRVPQDYVPVAAQAATIANSKPQVNRAEPYYVQDSTTFSKKVLGMDLSAPTPMVNRTAMRIAALDVCGTKVYMVTGFGNGSEAGFDRSSLVGLIAKVGGKTIVLGDASAQAWQENSWPISFAQSYVRETVQSLLGDRTTEGAYLALADLIGSTERPVAGELPTLAPLATHAGAQTASVAR